MFPLFRCEGCFQLLESAYVVLFSEIFAVIFVLHKNGYSAHLFLRSLFLCYFVGLLVFVLFPAVGPCIYFPETFSSAYHNTATFKLMHGMYAEFEALKHGAPLKGLGYFVALPSLHVAVAFLLQRFLSPFRVHFWMFIPVNTLIVLSTFNLGYHYVIDIPAGIISANDFLSRPSLPEKFRTGFVAFVFPPARTL